MRLKHTHILTVGIVLLGLFPPALRADESDSFQNYGSTTDSATPSASQSENYSAQDTGTTWRATITESSSYQEGGTGESEGGSDSDSDSGNGGSGGGGGSGGESVIASGGGRRNRAGAEEETDSGTSPTEETATPQTRKAVARTPRSPWMHPAAVSESGNRPAQNTDTRTATNPLFGNLDGQTAVAPPSPGLWGTQRFRLDADVHVAQESKPPSSSSLAYLTAANAGVAGRIAYVARWTAAYESLPAYAAGEGLSGFGGFALRRGSVRLSTFLPLFAMRKRKRRRIS